MQELHALCPTVHSGMIFMFFVLKIKGFLLMKQKILNTCTYKFRFSNLKLPKVAILSILLQKNLNFEVTEYKVAIVFPFCCDIWAIVAKPFTPYTCG